MSAAGAAIEFNYKKARRVPFATRLGRQRVWLSTPQWWALTLLHLSPWCSKEVEEKANVCEPERQKCLTTVTNCVPEKSPRNSQKSCLS